MREMKSSANKLNLLLGVFSSGSLRIRVEGFSLGDLRFTRDGIVIDLAERKEVRSLSKKLPKNLKSLSFLKQVSSFMNRLNISMEMRDRKGTVIGLGKGHHSMIGNLNVKLLKSLEYFR